MQSNPYYNNQFWLKSGVKGKGFVDILKLYFLMNRLETLISNNFHLTYNNINQQFIVTVLSYLTFSKDFKMWNLKERNLYVNIISWILVDNFSILCISTHVAIKSNFSFIGRCLRKRTCKEVWMLVIFATVMNKLLYLGKQNIYYAIKGFVFCVHEE